MHRVDHVKQTGCGILDVEMLVLARTAFRRQQTAAVDLLEIAVGELVPPLGLLALLIVYAQAPLAVFGVAVPLDERVLLVGGWACSLQSSRTSNTNLPALTSFFPYSNAILFNRTVMTCYLRTPIARQGEKARPPRARRTAPI